MTAAPQIITFEWQDEILQLKPTHDLYMQIEERVSFGRLANIFASASIGGNADVPMSHVSWVMYCALRHCGKAIISPMEVHRTLMEIQIGWGPVLSSLIAAYYGAAPAKKPIAKKATPARRRSRR